MRLLIAIALLLLPMPALAHRAQPTAMTPLGWNYSAMCCSGRDCAEIPDTFIHETPEGYQIEIPAGAHPMVKATYRDLIPYGDRRIKDAPDGRMHACISQPCTTTACQQRTFCLYIPPRGF